MFAGLLAALAAIIVEILFSRPSHDHNGNGSGNRKKEKQKEKKRLREILRKTFAACASGRDGTLERLETRVSLSDQHAQIVFAIITAGDDCQRPRRTHCGSACSPLPLPLPPPAPAVCVLWVVVGADLL